MNRLNHRSVSSIIPTILALLLLSMAFVVSTGCRNSNASGSTVTGRSLRFPVGSGIPFIRVLVNGPEALRFQVTDSNGSFTMVHVPVGTYDVKFARFGVLLYSTTLGVLDNEQTYVVNMPTIEVGSNPLTGLIQDSFTEEPLEGIEIWVIYADGGVAYSTTDENGEYLLENLPDGDVTLAVISDDYLPQIQDGVEIGFEGDLKQDFILDVIPDFIGGTVTGVVRTSDGEVLDEAYIGIFRNNVEPSIYMVAEQETLSTPDGYSLTPIPEGTYTVICAHSGYELDSEIVIIEPNQIYNIDFILDAEGLIPASNGN
jgi:hypothetical protein